MPNISALNHGALSCERSRTGRSSILLGSGVRAQALRPFPALARAVVLCPGITKLEIQVRQRRAGRAASAATSAAGNPFLRGVVYFHLRVSP